MRKDVFLSSKHPLSAFYKTLPSKNPSENLVFTKNPYKAPYRNPSKQHLLLENLLRTLLRSVRLHDPLGVRPSEFPKGMEQKTVWQFRHFRHEFTTVEFPLLCSCDIWETGGKLFREYCFVRGNPLSSAANSMSSAKFALEYKIEIIG